MTAKFILLLLVGCTAGASAGVIETTAGGDGVFRFSGTDHLIIDGRKDPDDNASPNTNQVMHETSLSGQLYNYSFNIDFTDRVGLDNYSSYVNAPFTLEKSSAKWEYHDWELSLGDSHQEIGRGIALSLYRDDVFGIDNTLLGGTARFHPSSIDAEIFAGKIHSILSPVAINPVDSTLLTRNVWIAGGTIAVDLSKETKVGLHYFGAAEIPNDPQKIDAVWHTAGAIFSRDNVLEGVDFYAESNVLLSQSIFNGNSTALPTGFGSYGALVWSPSPWKVKWEVKDYRNDNFEFRRPPTLEEDIIQTLDIVDVTGSRWMAERRWGEHTTVAASFLYGYDRELQGSINHGVVGIKFRAPFNVDVEARTGYRWVPGQENMIHGTLKAHMPTFTGQSVEVSALIQYYNQRLNFTPTPDDRHVFGLAYNFSEKFSTNLGYEYVPTNSDSLGQSFLNIGGTFKTGALVARVFAGQTSGGTVCSGGVCRVVPPFTGALAETTYTF
jgi:hypothetical protein